MAVGQSTHLPLEWVVSSRVPETSERVESVAHYARFALNDGVQTPLNISTYKDGREVSQIFLDGCKYNLGVSPHLFTRASLEEREKEATTKGHSSSPRIPWPR